ncbi:ABC transporter permease [Curtobacterium sp. Leaf261]|uniref:ABC transporter permease n=1 Tax=Curtobacterium sp. Leaf261 TaxID=1736311 RepID=UPI0006FCCEDB|nr:ABC transporter permease [Curtobacterium sp. Leaf261]KQO62304.1 peptide ABC transporter permease [Curtobacterium sp. Leaf261]
MTANVIDRPVASSPRSTGFRAVVRRVRGDRAAVASAVAIVLFAVVAVGAPLVAGLSGQDPYTYHLGTLNGFGAPKGTGGGISGTHWFGVEPLTGRDLFAIVTYGARTSLGIGLAATVMSIAIGVLVGVTTGFFGGWYDRGMSRVIDVMFGFPSLVFMIALTAIVPGGFPKPVLVVLVIGFFGWPSVARVIRGQTLSLRQRNFVVASTAMGGGSWHVIVRQLLPNLAATISVYATISIPSMIGAEAALSFLSVGVTPPTPSWGRTIGDAVGWVQTDPMYLVFPGAALFVITLAFNLLGDALRDALDPRRADSARPGRAASSKPGGARAAASKEAGR